MDHRRVSAASSLILAQVNSFLSANARRLMSVIGHTAPGADTHSLVSPATPHALPSSIVPLPLTSLLRTADYSLLSVVRCLQPAPHAPATRSRLPRPAPSGTVMRLRNPRGVWRRPHIRLSGRASRRPWPPRIRPRVRLTCVAPPPTQAAGSAAHPYPPRGAARSSATRSIDPQSATRWPARRGTLGFARPAPRHNTRPARCPVGPDARGRGPPTSQPRHWVSQARSHHVNRPNRTSHFRAQIALGDDSMHRQGTWQSILVALALCVAFAPLLDVHVGYAGSPAAPLPRPDAASAATAPNAPGHHFGFKRASVLAQTTGQQTSIALGQPVSLNTVATQDCSGPTPGDAGANCVITGQVAGNWTDTGWASAWSPRPCPRRSTRWRPSSSRARRLAPRR